MPKWLDRLWYSQKLPLWAKALCLLELIYILCIKLRKTLYLIYPRYSPKVPLIIVGNLTLGGTGKTPLVEYLSNYYSELGYTVGIITRGYGSNISGNIILDRSSKAIFPGLDEPLLLAKNTSAKIAVGKNRIKSIQLLLELGIQIIISDDGWQHYAIRPDVVLVTIDGDRRLGNKHCLPLGPLREPINRLDESDVIFINNNRSEWSPENHTASVKSMDLVPIEYRNLLNYQLKPLLPSWDKVHVVAGIGNNERFFAVVRKLVSVTIEHAFPDHHQYKPSDLAFKENLPIIMTQKDAVKCTSFATAQMWYIATKLEISESSKILGEINAMISPKLLAVLACPLCKGQLELDKVTGELKCNFDRLAYQIKDGIPVMLEQEARKF